MPNGPRNGFWTGLFVTMMSAGIIAGAGGLVGVAVLGSRTDTLETVIHDHRERPCHTETCVALGRIETKLDAILKQLDSRRGTP